MPPEEDITAASARAGAPLRCSGGRAARPATPFVRAPFASAVAFALPRFNTENRRRGNPQGLPPGFFELFFPDAAARLDFDSVRFPDKELFKGFPEGRRREPDVVPQVQSRDGEPEMVLVCTPVRSDLRGPWLGTRIQG